MKDEIEKIEDSVSENAAQGSEDAAQGSENAVVGNENAVSGNEDAVSGNENAVSGNENAVSGNENAEVDSENTVSGSENAAQGSEITAADTKSEANNASDAPADEPVEPQDTPRFTVKTTLNAKMQYEASRALTPKYAQITVWVCIGLAAVMFCLSLVQFFRTKDSSNLLMAGMLALLLLYLCYTQFSTPKKALQRWEENIRRNFGATELHLTTEFFALNLAQSIDEGDDVTVEGYSALGRMVETERLLLIQSGRRQWFFLEKSGLQSGTVEELKAFLSEHIGGK